MYTDKEYEGRRIASIITRILIDSYGYGNLMASTEITANPAMCQNTRKKWIPAIWQAMEKQYT